MLARSYSAVLVGLHCTVVEVEVDGSRGQPSLVLIGLPNKAVGEAKERITSALQNCGIRIRSLRTIVNLAPAEVQKTSSALELAIAVGLLKMYGEITFDLQKSVFFGELSLDGSLKAVRGLLPMVLAAKKSGFRQVFFPEENREELRLVRGIEKIPLRHLEDVLLFDKDPTALVRMPEYRKVDWEQERRRRELTQRSPSRVDFEQIIGLEEAKKALEISAAGGHNILLLGSPGIGKSMLAKAMKSILPPLNFQENLEVVQLHSIRGELAKEIFFERPFRAPHHSLSVVGLVGGGQQLLPGEISLAHRGVLFLDELTEFPRMALEVLRQPLEDGSITITRAVGSVCYPARFTLVAAANPCPCGYFLSQKNRCRCSERTIEIYQQKLSGPILDRIDLQVKISDAHPGSILELRQNSETSQEVRARVVQARERQQERQQKLNAVLEWQEVQKNLLSSQVKAVLQKAAQKMNLSPRSILKVLRVAQTIADLEGEAGITAETLKKALLYRFSYT